MPDMISDAIIYVAVIRAKSSNPRIRNRGFTDLIRLTRPHRNGIRRYWRTMDRYDFDAAYDDGIMRAVADYDPVKASFPAFLTVAARGCLYRAAKRFQLRTVSLHATYANQSCTRRHDLADQLQDAEADTYSDVAETDYAQYHGTRAFAALTAAEQSAVAHDLEGIGMTETATLTGASAKQVDNALERGYRKLKAYGRRQQASDEREDQYR